MDDELRREPKVIGVWWARYRWSTSVKWDASDIEARVENGEVVLTGFVHDKFLKRRAEDLLDQLSGINNVENRLRTRDPGENILDVRNTGG